VSPRILIAGGYGVVGGQVARLIRAAGHPVDLVLAGRGPHSGEALARELDARVVRLDVADPADALAAAGPVDLVVAALQDPGDNLLTATLRAGAAHIGIVGMAESVASTMIAACHLGPDRPVLILGHWQAGALVTAARVAARAFTAIDRVELTALYDYADPIGPMTAGDAEGFVGRATLRRDGDWVRVDAKGEPRRVGREGAPPFDALPTGVLDIFSLAGVTGAPNVRFDLGVGDSLGTLAGGPASHDLYIDIEGTLGSGPPARRRWRLSDPKGQAHLTALGVLIGIERVLGLDGAPPMPGGLSLAETLPDPERMLARLRAFGVRFDEETLP
jgi:hypothetical protein